MRPHATPPPPQWGTVRLALRGPSKPNFEIADLDDVLGFALLEASFNDLPVEARIELVGTMVGRFQSMDAGDSVLLAAFAAGVTGEAREQLERNAARLAIDLFDMHAVGYGAVPPEERGAYLDQTLVEFVRTTSLLGGKKLQQCVAKLNSPHDFASGCTTR